MSTYPLILAPSGYVPQTPAFLLSQLTAAVKAVNPGYTNILPGGLIEDISSTDVYALIQADTAIAEIIAAMSPYTSNPYLLNLFGQCLGVQLNQGNNTSVYVTFFGDPGYIINRGFVVSDGTFQYTVQDGGSILSNGQSNPLFCLANQTGNWAIPIGTVTQTITSVPAGFTVTCSNQSGGTPSVAVESENSYRTRVQTALLAASQGMARYLRTYLTMVAGVNDRLIATKQMMEGGPFEVIVGGGDPYQIAYAIYRSDFAFNQLSGSVLTVASISQASIAKVTLNLQPRYTDGQAMEITGVVGMTEVNGNTYYAKNVPGDPYSLHLYTDSGLTSGLDSTGFVAYVSGGVMTPNFRNITPSVIDYPDTYSITFVNPPRQSVSMTVTWNTIDPNFVNPNAVAQLAAAPLAAYINGIYVGQPINEAVLIQTFQNAVQSLIPTNLLTRIVFAVNIDGVGVSPLMGTYEIVGDPEGYFGCSVGNISIVNG